MLAKWTWGPFWQAVAAIGSLLASAAAWRATVHVRRDRQDEWFLRVQQHLRTIHGLVSALAQSRPDDSNYGWQGPQLTLRAEAAVIFHPLPKCTELAGVTIPRMDTQAYYDLVKAAIGEVEAAQVATAKEWNDHQERRWTWQRIRHPSRWHRRSAEEGQS